MPTYRIVYGDNENVVTETYEDVVVEREDGWVVLRCVNRRDEAVAGAWRTGRAVAEASVARLDETRLSPLVVRDRVIEFEAAPQAIVTVLARWADEG